MTDATAVALLGVLGAVVASLFGSSWLNRKNLARLTRARADQSEASTVEISDRIARGWLLELEDKLTLTNARLDDEIKVRMGAIAYIERLLDWVKDSGVDTVTVPPIPEALKSYLH
jgi:hypothetical protein